MALTKVSYSMIQKAPINVVDYGATGNGVTNDQAAFDAAVLACKNSGRDLYIPAGNYNAGLNIDWAVQQASVTSISSAPTYNPATYGPVGLAFRVTLDKSANIQLDSYWTRLKDFSITGGTFAGNIILCSIQLCEFNEITCQKVISYAYAPSTNLPLRPYLTWAIPPTDGPGDILWTQWNKCQAQALVIQGSTVASHNVATFTDCLLSGATNANRQTGTDYLDHHGASRYIDMAAGQGQCLNFIGCDFSYSDFPLWSEISYPVTDIGCYYEGAGWNFYTGNGVTISQYVATIINGYNYALVIQPQGTLTLSATTGSGVTATSSINVFQASDVGKYIRVGSYSGSATITGYTSATQVTVNVTSAFPSVGPHAANTWVLQREPQLQPGILGQGFRLIASNLSGSSGYFEVIPQGGTINVLDVTSNNLRASFNNLSGYETALGGAPVWRFYGDQYPYVDGSIGPAAQFGNRTYRNWTELKCSRHIIKIAPSASSANILVLEPIGGASAYTNLEGNARIRVTFVGSVHDNTPGNPVAWEGYANCTTKQWSSTTTLVGSLTGTRATATITAGTSDGRLFFGLTNLSGTGRLSGELFVEVVVSTIQASGGTEEALAEWQLIPY
jgi:hypothetical protein